MEFTAVNKALGKDAILWRYFDFQKFLSFAIDQSIFFSRMDKMEDSNEGISIYQLQSKFGTSEEKKKAKDTAKKTARNEMPLALRQKKYFISCWLLHYRESVAMWNTYSNDSGIAVKVNAAALIENIIDNSSIVANQEKLKTMHYGKIEYKDFFDPIHRSNFKQEVKIIGFQKDISFEHEHEYRFLIKQDMHHFGKEDIPFVKLKLEKFKKIPFEVIFHPKMEDWKKANIQQVIASFNLSNISCKDSELQLKSW